MNADRLMDDCLRGDPNVAVAWFLMSSYLYYHKDISILSDERFDRLCHDMVRDWPKLKHRHKYLIKVEDLRAGTGFALREGKYPARTISAAVLLHEEMT